MFENLENLSKDDSRYARVGFAVLAAFIFVPVFVYAFGLFESDAPQLDHTLLMNSDEAAERRVDELCKSLPTPENFELMRKLPTEYFYRRVAVDYIFSSDYRTLEETIPTFVLWFAENGWTQSFFNKQDGYVRLEYKKNNQTVTLKSENQNRVYTASCSERELNSMPRLH